MKTDLLKQPLDYIFSAPSHISICRALQFSLQGMSGREVARQAGINHQACLQSLLRMEALGIVERRGSGKTHLFMLNRKHFLVNNLILPFLRTEIKYFQEVVHAISRMLKRLSISVVMFGSAARGETAAESDLDILVVVKGLGAKARVRDVVDSNSLIFYRCYGLNISPIIQTLPEIKNKVRKKDKFLLNILHGGKLISGRKIEEYIP